jgi:dipeptidyl aminopeptidase/acylaminoacyl peptidase
MGMHNCNTNTEKFRSVLFLILILGLSLGIGRAFQAEDKSLKFEERYLLPPQEVQDILKQDKHYDTLRNLSPDGEHFLIPVQGEFSTLELMTQRTLRLGMLELCPDVNREWRLSTYGIQELAIFSLSKMTRWTASLPEDTFVSDMTWAPDGKTVAFLAHLPQGTQVWTADIGSGKTHRLSQAWVMATLTGLRRYDRSGGAASQMLQWTPDGGVISLLVPPNREPEPHPPAVPKTPLIRRTRKKASPTSTYPFLLRTPHDKELFRYYTTSQVALLKPGQKPRLIGPPAMYMSISLSPDGAYILAEKIVEPFSYIVSYSSFPKDLVVMDLNGRILSTIRQIPLQEGSSQGGNRVTADLPRDVAWRPDGKGLSFLWREPREKSGEEEQEEGDDTQERGDRLMLLAPPFDMDQGQILITHRKRFSQVSYTMSGKYAFARLTGRGEDCETGTDITAFDLTQSPPRPYMLLKDVETEDPLKLPGDILNRHTPNGLAYALTASGDDAVYLQGSGYKENFAPQPFIDRIAITGAGRERIFEGSSDMYELPLVPLDRDLNSLVISGESRSQYPESYLWTRGGSRKRLTQNRNPFPQLEGCRREAFEFTRRDGLKIQATIALPPGYREGERVPAVFWTYPREYTSFKDYQRASQRSRNHNSFPHLSSRNASDIWLTQGYAVVVPDIPIIGKGNSYNNNYIAHLVDSMYAAIRKVDELGYVDVDRLGHGGHSYGAFATANVLARTPFFKAGIAGDGAYNRTLTPMSFQRERRFIWEAHDVYIEMSPFFQADHIDTPLLMYHGAQDNNTGTFLIQSERLIQALTGLGKTAVLYIYPFESHGPRCLETYLDLWTRWLEWFDTYVKNSNGHE